MTAYYFPGAANCTVMMDFAPAHGVLDALPKDEREASLAVQMLREVAANAAKCGGSQTIRALAVEIPGTDNYGRPNFGSRKNLLVIEGPAAAMVNRADGETIRNVGQLEPELKITEY